MSAECQKQMFLNALIATCNASRMYPCFFFILVGGQGNGSAWMLLACMVSCLPDVSFVHFVLIVTLQVFRQLAKKLHHRETVSALMDEIGITRRGISANDRVLLYFLSTSSFLLFLCWCARGEVCFFFI